jgi:hypothetical protein
MISEREHTRTFYTAAETVAKSPAAAPSGTWGRGTGLSFWPQPTNTIAATNATPVVNP